MVKWGTSLDELEYKNAQALGQSNGRFEEGASQQGLSFVDAWICRSYRLVVSHCKVLVNRITTVASYSA